ncbi:sugar transferase [Luminiphilus sp.]|nr:sugar transferase [Luminiphilus sp.]
MIIRVFDLLLAGFGLMAAMPLLMVVLLFGWFDTGSPLFRQKRVGRSQEPFTLIKFRTMSVNTKSVATHLADKNAITRFGAFLRGSKIDELPQLWNVLTGKMSMVGPRPNLPNQAELISERQRLGIYEWRPGITGLAQIEGIDMSTPQQLALTDKKMLDQLSLTFYFKIIFLTALGRGMGDRVGP